MGLARKAAHIGLFVLGVVLSIAVTPALRSHTVELIRHLNSGNWEIITDRGAVERLIRAKYADSSAWTIHFPAASGQSFPLFEASRRETINILGHQLLAESPNLRFTSTPLQSAYGGFLAQALLEQVSPPPRTAHETNPLRLLAFELAQPSPADGAPIDPELYAQAQDYLSRLPKTNLLKKALTDYVEFGTSRGLDFPAFDVATSPSFDQPGAWDHQAQTLPQLGKCKAVIASLAEPARHVNANVALLPRILEVSLNRPWLSDALIDNIQKGRGSLTRPYFETDGDLRLVPERFWVLLPDAVWIEPVADSDRSDIASWGKSGTCCRIECNDSAFVLDPASLKANRDSTFSARRSDLSPVLYAVISRRRATE